MESVTDRTIWGPRRRAGAGDTVQIHYTGKLVDGTVCLESWGRRPLQFTIGHQRIIMGIDEAVVGMCIGETRKITVQPQNAFGEHRDGMLIRVDRKRVQAGSTLKIGQSLWTTCPDGRRMSVTVVEISDSGVMLDTNHPLAGRVIAFEVNLVGIL